MSSPLTTNEGNSYDARISLLETQLWSTNNTLMKILDNLRKMTDSYVTEDDADKLISTKLEKSLVNEIQSSHANLSHLVENSLSSIENRFEALKEEISSKIDNKVKRDHRQDNDFVNKKINEVRNSLSRTTISKDEFASFQLSVARETSILQFQEGKWVVFQKRGQFGNSKNYFARSMEEYVNGFGNPVQEFWLGLDKLVRLTKKGAELYIELETFEGEIIEARYSRFQVYGDDYRIKVSGYSGNAGDPLRIDNGMAFSARDNDKDLWDGDCSKTRGGGGWWYNGCGLANLNGLNLGKNQEGYEGILWYLYAKDNRSFKATKMMLRKL